MSALQELVGEIRVDHSGVSKGVNKAQGEMDSLESKAQSVGKSMQSTGKTMTMGLTAPIVAAGAASVKMAADFEGAMQQSIAIMGDVSDAEREKLEETARDVAKSTTASHEEAAESYYFLASAGMDATESMEAMPQVAAYAESAQLDMATATDYSTDIMSAFGYEASELAEVTDTLTAAVSNHNTTAEGMGEAMSYVAPVAESVGMSIQETSAAIGMFSDVGIKGSKAGTSLRTAISNLNAPTAAQKELLEDLGVQTHDSQGNMREFTDIVRDLEEAGADSADIMQIFGKEAGPAMTALLKQGADQLEENTKALEDAEGATKDVAETQRDTLHGQIAMTKSAFADVAIELGTELIPFLKVLTRVLTSVADNWGGMNPMVRKAIIVIAGLVAVIGPLLMVFGTILTMLPAMAAGFGMLAAVTAPISLPILAIVAAIGLLAAAWAGNWLGIRDKTAAAANFIMDKLGALASYLDADFPTSAAEARANFNDNMSRLRSGAASALDKTKSKMSSFTGWAKNKWANYDGAAKGIIEAHWGANKRIWRDSLANIEDLQTMKTAVLTGDWETAKETWIRIWKRIGNGILDVARWMSDQLEGTVIGNLLSNIRSKITNFSLVGAGKALIQSFAKGIRNAADAATDAAKDVVSDVRGFFPGSDADEGPLDDVSTIGPTLVEMVSGDIESHAPRAAGASETLAGAMRPAPAAGQATGSQSVQIEFVRRDGGDDELADKLWELFEPRVKNKEELEIDQITGGTL